MTASGAELQAEYFPSAVRTSVTHTTLAALA